MIETASVDDRASIAEHVRASVERLTAQERKAAQVLLTNYPAAGLAPVAEFAERARVSAPTVTRPRSSSGAIRSGSWSMKPSRFLCDPRPFHRTSREAAVVITFAQRQENVLHETRRANAGREPEFLFFGRVSRP